MKQFLAQLKRSFSNRWTRYMAALVLVPAFGGTAIAVAGVDQAREAATSLWDGALEWAGLRSAGGDSGTTYWCPMHPQIKRKNANDVCPICNMALVPLEGDSNTGAADHLTLTPRQVQQAGVVTAPVLRRKLYREIDTTGRIECDERRLATITSWVWGKSRIDKLHIDFTGAHVEKGQLMAELFSRELILAQEEHLLTLKGPHLSGIDLVSQSRQKLRDQGLTAEQIQQLERTRQVVDSIPIYATITGTVLQRNVREGEYVNEGDVLFQISDLTHLWLFADVYEEELPLVELGQPVELSVRSFPGKTFEGTVAFIDPMVQPDTRTVRVRIEIPNPGGSLKPGMYARVGLRKELPEMLAVPENAVLWSGQRQVVLVRQGEGSFQPRDVRIGHRWLYPVGADDYRPGGDLEFGATRQRYNGVLAGVHPGEQVVTAGAFLLGAESQFQSVLTKMLPSLEQSVTLEEAIGKPLAKGIRELLDGYYGLSQALADDDLETARAQFALLAQAAEALGGEAEAAGRTKLAGAALRIADGARNEPSPEDLREARTRFGRISRSLVQLLAENGGQTLFGKNLFLFECGMAKVGYENWLWWSSEKLNPYMGKKMLDCGTQLKALEP